MIEQLGEHGVTAMDLVPSLITTHTVPNPEYDPEAEREREEEEAEEAARLNALEAEEAKTQGEKVLDRPVAATDIANLSSGVVDDIADDLDGATLHDHDDGLDKNGEPSTPEIRPSSLPEADATPTRQATVSSALEGHTQAQSATSTTESSAEPVVQTPTKESVEAQYTKAHWSPAAPLTEPASPHTPASNLLKPLPNALPGVTTNLTAADKTVTLDIRWTILCDLFLALIADSVYDARSRVLLGQIADKLGLTWSDVIRFERRLTEALEVQEGIAKREQGDVMEERRKATQKKRYMMMGLATVGGGLVIGLSAGLLAPLIGAGIGAAFGAVGVSGTTAFLTGAGGAAVITTGGALTGANIGVRGMARRTKHVTTFDFIPLHNNKRLNVLITIPGWVSVAFLFSEAYTW